MTKKQKVVCIVLKVLGYLLGFGGLFFMLGSVGSLECETISYGQFWMQELIALISVILAFACYQIRFEILWYVEDKARKNRKKVHNK